jgi:chromosome segregation ATPase
MTDVDINFLAKQNARILEEIRSMRDDMTVLTAIVLRLDATLTALLHEIRATHTQIARMNDRIRKLENEGPNE